MKYSRFEFRAQNPPWRGKGGARPDESWTLVVVLVQGFKRKVKKNG